MGSYSPLNLGFGPAQPNTYCTATLTVAITPLGVGRFQSRVATL